MSVKIIWHGHANFQIIGTGFNVLIDPFFTHNPKAVVDWKDIEPPDLVLVTHLHGDHEGDAVEICKNTGAMLGCVVGAAGVLHERGVPEAQIVNGIGFNIGGTVRHKGVSVTMTEAFHTTEAGAPTGFIVTLPGGFTIYHAGDTGIFSNMQTWGELYQIDLALLPIGGVFTMDARQAARAAKMLGAGSCIPMHWGTFPLLAQDTDEFEALLGKACPECRFIRAEPGQPLALS